MRTKVLKTLTLLVLIATTLAVYNEWAFDPSSLAQRQYNTWLRSLEDLRPPSEKDVTITLTLPREKTPKVLAFRQDTERLTWSQVTRVLDLFRETKIFAAPEPELYSEGVFVEIRSENDYFCRKVALGVFEEDVRFRLLVKLLDEYSKEPVAPGGEIYENT